VSRLDSRVQDSCREEDLNPIPLRALALKLSGSTDTSVAPANIPKRECAAWSQGFWAVCPPTEVGSYFWIDPVERITALFLAQVLMSPTQFQLRPQLHQLVNQALID
jgi:hypothetical protein